MTRRRRLRAALPRSESPAASSARGGSSDDSGGGSGRRAGAGAGAGARPGPGAGAGFSAEEAAATEAAAVPAPLPHSGPPSAPLTNGKPLSCWGPAPLCGWASYPANRRRSGFGGGRRSVSPEDRLSVVIISTRPETGASLGQSFPLAMRSAAPRQWMRANESGFFCRQPRGSARRVEGGDYKSQHAVRFVVLRVPYREARELRVP
ncbi:uncharacterized protein LOC144457464 [Phascolarctos cinereus]